MLRYAINGTASMVQASLECKDVEQVKPKAKQNNDRAASQAIRANLQPLHACLASSHAHTACSSAFDTAISMSCALSWLSGCASMRASSSAQEAGEEQE
jgi:hypothetical protein